MAKTYTNCPVEYTASIIANKWKILILRDLLTGTKRYTELTRSVVGISAKVLTENLRDLENDGIIFRKVYPVVPPKVEYSLTEKGKELKDVLDSMRLFGEKYKDEKKYLIVTSNQEAEHVLECVSYTKNLLYLKKTPEDILTKIIKIYEENNY